MRKLILIFILPPWDPPEFSFIGRPGFEFNSILGCRVACREIIRVDAARGRRSSYATAMPAAPRKRKSRRKKSESLLNIKRIDSTKTHGWQVHIRRGGVQKTKLFSDRVFDGKKKALQAAIKHRNKLSREMEKLAKPLWRIDREPRSNTGHLGVSYIEVKNDSGDVRSAVTVTVRASVGKAVNRKFSVDKLGYDEALAKAVAWRKSVLRKRGQTEKKKSPPINGSHRG